MQCYEGGGKGSAHNHEDQRSDHAKQSLTIHKYIYSYTIFIAPFFTPPCNIDFQYKQNLSIWMGGQSCHRPQCCSTRRHAKH